MINFINGLMSFHGSPNNWMKDLIADLRPYIISIFAVVAAAGVGYAIYLAFLLAKAEDQGKRKEAKGRILKTCIGLGIIVVLTVALFSNEFLDGLSVNTKNRDEEREWVIRLASPITTGKNKGQYNWSLSSVSGGGGKIQIYRKPRLDNGEFGPEEAWPGTNKAVRVVILTQSPDDKNQKNMGADIKNTGKINSVTVRPGVTIDTDKLGSTGNYFYALRTGAISISIEYFDIKTGSFQIAVRDLGIRIYP